MKLEKMLGRSWLLITLGSLALAGATVSCSKKDTAASATTTDDGSDGGAGGGAGGGGGGDSGVTASISGFISSGIGATSPAGRMKFARVRGIASAATGEPADVCASGSFTGAYVGDGGTQIVSGTYSDGAFTVPAVVQGKELILTFTCSDASSQRCMVKSGDAGVSCDPVADAVIAAFEEALGKTIYDASFKGKSIAKVGASIVQASQTESTATDAFNAQILACADAADKPGCYKDAIMASPFAGAFKMMQTMVQGWSAEAIFTLLADVFGANIQIDSFIYSSMASVIDDTFNTTFVADTRDFVKNVVDDQLAGGNTYVVKLECQLYYNKYHGGGQFKFSPVMATVDGIEQPTCKNNAALEKTGSARSRSHAFTGRWIRPTTTKTGT